MRQICYYVATSLDGYISGPDDDISEFLPYEDLVKKYLDDLNNYDTTIMGRKTYELGYKFGLNPGQPAYAHMQHYIFSNTIQFAEKHDQVHICKLELDKIKEIKDQKGTDIYLCGGGHFAGWLLQHKMIDTLKIKLNPYIQGNGIKLFEGIKKAYRLELTDILNFDEGAQLIDYNIIY